MLEVEMEKINEFLSNHGYEYKQFLGSGSFSNVFLCESRKYHQQFAVKRAMKHKISEDEYKTLISLNHPNIIQLYDSFEDEESQYLIMDYCQKGSITKMGPLSLGDFVFYAKQILNALQFCHSKQIAHRDIKPDNIFIDQYNHIKLGDFGLSKQFIEKKKSNNKCGSLVFFAPEMFKCKEYCPFKTDIWALGVTFFIMATGRHPYKAKSLEDLKSWVLFGSLDYDDCQIDPQIRFIINKMTDKNPKLRPSIDNLLKYPIFSSSFIMKSSLILCPKKNFYTTGYSAQPNTNSILYQNNFSDDYKNQIEVLSYRNIVAYPIKQRNGIRNMAKL